MEIQSKLTKPADFSENVKRDADDTKYFHRLTFTKLLTPNERKYIFGIFRFYKLVEFRKNCHLEFIRAKQFPLKFESKLTNVTKTTLENFSIDSKHDLSFNAQINWLRQCRSKFLPFPAQYHCPSASNLYLSPFLYRKACHFYGIR